jgi:hypothetical protein
VAGFVPEADGPVGALAGGERRSGVGDGEGIIAGDFAGVPEIGLTGLEAGGRAGDEDFVGGLRVAAVGGTHFPAESGVVLVDADRIVFVLDAEVLRGGGGATSEGDGHRRACNGRRQQGCFRHVALLKSALFSFAPPGCAYYNQPRPGRPTQA